MLCFRDCGLHFPASSSDDSDICAVCLERACSVAAEGNFIFFKFSGQMDSNVYIDVDFFQDVVMNSA